MSRENFSRFERGQENILKRFVTVDETWVHHLEPKTKRLTVKTVETPRITNPPPKKKSHVDNMRWEGDGHSFLGCGRCYAVLMRQLREKIKYTRRGKLSLGMLFHQDNAPAHKSAVAMAAVQEFGF